MEQTKQKLSQLINSINESFSDEADLKGFPGISKSLIADTLTESSALLIQLTSFDSHFETIIMKRELAELFEKIGKELEEGFDKIKPAQFNAILKQITRIKFLIREAFIAIGSSQPIRTEAEIVKAKEELSLLNANIDELKKINIDLTVLKTATEQSLATTEQEIKILKDSTVQNITTTQAEINTLKETTVNDINTVSEEIKVQKDTAEKTLADFEEKRKSSTEGDQKINEFVAKIAVHETTISEIEKNTTQLQLEIETTRGEISKNKTEYTSLNTKSKELQLEIEKTHEKIFGKKDVEGKISKNGYLQETEELKNKIATFLTEQNRKFKAQFDEIEGMLPGATSAGLAEAYLKQKLSYNKPIRRWSNVFIGTIISMGVLSLTLITIQLCKDEVLSIDGAFISLLRDLPFFIPTIWLAAYASKQQSQYKRLKQEYAFKETNARSFHGHKRQIEELMKEGETDKDLLMQLVAQLVIITSQNPSVTLDNKSHEDSSPILKFMDKFFTSKKKQVV